MKASLFHEGMAQGLHLPADDPPRGRSHQRERLLMLTHTAKIAILFLLAPAALVARPPLPSDQKPVAQAQPAPQRPAPAPAQPAPQPAPQQRPAQPAPQG